MYTKQHLTNGLQHQKANQTMTKYAFIWSQNIHFITTLQNSFNKSCWGVCTYVIETNKYGIIWSQTVHFVTPLMVPPNKKLI